MALDSNILEQIDFSGGITDNDIGSTANKCSECDNLLITPGRKLESRHGSVIDNAAHPLPPLGTVRLGNLVNYESDSVLLVRQQKAFHYRDTTSGEYQTITGPTGNHVFNAALPATPVNVAAWNKHLFACSDGTNKPVKLYKDGSTWHCVTAGLPSLPSAPSFANDTGSASYMYAFAYKRTYTIGDLTFEDWGPTTVVIKEEIELPSTFPVAITGLTHITNTASDNYDTANTVIGIFRTINAGTTLYKIAELSPGTTSYNDSATDDSILSNEVIYTTGDVLENNPPPANASLIHITNSIAYWGVGSRVYQSVAGDPDSVPETNYREFDETITGISSVNGIPIVFGRHKVWRIDGVIDELGVGDMTAVKISDTAGCINHASIVQTSGNAIVWFGVDGIYTTNGYQVLRINDDQPARYAAMTAVEGQRSKIQGVYDQVGNRVYWAVQQDEGSLDNDSCLILDLRWGLGPTASFTTMSGGESFQPSSLVFFGGKLYRGDSRGYVLVHSEEHLTDPVIDTTAIASSWHTQPVVFTYKSIHHNFGTSSLRKMVSRIVLTCENISNVSLAVRSINDMNSKSTSLIPIRFRSNVTWGDSSAVWGDDSLVWDFTGIIEEKRRFPARGLRCNYKQIEITNGSVILTNSDNLGTASFVGNALVLDDPSSEWPEDCIGQFIRFEDDEYSGEYLIKTRSDSTLTFDSPLSLPTGSGKKWDLYGVYKDERIHLVGYVLNYGFITATQTSFTGKAGGNAR